MTTTALQVAGEVPSPSSKTLHAGGPWNNAPLYGNGILEANATNERSNGDLVVPSFSLADAFGILLCILIAPLGVPLYLVFFVYLLPVFTLLRLYLACLPAPTMRISRHCGFQLTSLVLFLLTLPLLLLTALYLTMSLVVIALPGSILYGFITCNIRHFCRNMTVLKDHRRLGHWSWNDIVVVVLGEVHRQGVWKLALVFPCVCLVVPLLKYVFVVNPFLFPLKETFTNQWTEAMPMTDATIVSSIVKSVTWSVVDRSTREEIRNDYFSANYPLPEKKDDVVVGIQVMSIVNLTNSIHNVENKLVRSTTAKRGLFRVPLYLYNPFHIMTGYVEVNLQFGFALEHPMWCITGTNYLGNQFYKNANALFWNYAPQIAYDLKKDPLNA
ncbi:hypothetical protein SDRG_16696 [Saprolegnia diclina VS20]|uniref:Uncharacterized protein n=1 Tax=Saprolegnia diclina (strain VS20) TaxID=1156394 RepID=T0PWN3_SAPDV|nr:hypothetical protein SDRG_16696 [Saprolegnia diclina VS20]EQC25430.1 hypothetical protein SDRG_16696 [Saprolegnia diclina VS20]|eukprot:XP_008621136.1 hypothetical protein SDRG_16696 [Saprolegnia diclina VS20]